jgi:hypothetical protein
MDEYGMTDFLADMKFTDPNYSDCGCVPDAEPCEAHARYYRITQFVEQLDCAGLDECETAHRFRLIAEWLAEELMERERCIDERNKCHEAKSCLECWMNKAMLAVAAQGMPPLKEAPCAD